MIIQENSGNILLLVTQLFWYTAILLLCTFFPKKELKRFAQFSIFSLHLHSEDVTKLALASTEGQWHPTPTECEGWWDALISLGPLRSRFIWWQFKNCIFQQPPPAGTLQPCPPNYTFVLGDPASSTDTCNIWRSHPDIWKLMLIRVWSYANTVVKLVVKTVQQITVVQQQ